MTHEESQAEQNRIDLEQKRSRTPWLIAGIVIVVVALVFRSRRKRDERADSQ